MTTEPSRRRRSDAQRNVTGVLEAAKAVFAVDGVDVPAKVIADRAGVGVGTLYRHYPRRSDLIVAVLQHEIDACLDAAVELAATHAPREALGRWIDRFTDFVATKRGLAQALHSGNPAYDDLPRQLLDRLEPALRDLLDRAVGEGLVRDDVPPREVLATVALLCHTVPGAAPDFTRRMTRVFVDGLATRADVS